MLRHEKLSLWCLLFGMFVFECDNFRDLVSMDCKQMPKRVVNFMNAWVALTAETILMHGRQSKKKKKKKNFFGA